MSVMLGILFTTVGFGAHGTCCWPEVEYDPRKPDVRILDGRFVKSKAIIERIEDGGRKQREGFSSAIDYLREEQRKASAVFRNNVVLEADDPLALLEEAWEKHRDEEVNDVLVDYYNGDMNLRGVFESDCNVIYVDDKLVRIVGPGPVNEYSCRIEGNTFMEKLKNLYEKNQGRDQEGKFATLGLEDLEQVLKIVLENRCELNVRVWHIKKLVDGNGVVSYSYRRDRGHGPGVNRTFCNDFLKFVEAKEYLKYIRGKDQMESVNRLFLPVSRVLEGEKWTGERYSSGFTTVDLLGCLIKIFHSTRLRVPLNWPLYFWRIFSQVKAENVDTLNIGDFLTLGEFIDDFLLHVAGPGVGGRGNYYYNILFDIKRLYGQLKFKYVPYRVLEKFFHDNFYKRFYMGMWPLEEAEQTPKKFYEDLLTGFYPEDLIKTLFEIKKNLTECASFYLEGSPGNGRRVQDLKKNLEAKPLLATEFLQRLLPPQNELLSEEEKWIYDCCIDAIKEEIKKIEDNCKDNEDLRTEKLREYGKHLTMFFSGGETYIGNFFIAPDTSATYRDEEDNCFILFDSKVFTCFSKVYVRVDRKALREDAHLVNRTGLREGVMNMNDRPWFIEELKKCIFSAEMVCKLANERNFRLN